MKSVETRDSNLDGFNEWRAAITHVLPRLPIRRHPERGRIKIETTEYDQGSQMPFRRWTRTYPGGRTMHVKLEEGLGKLKVVSEYDAPAAVESKAQATAFPEGLLAEARAETAPVSVPCPAGLEAEVLSMLPISAGNGGGCLHNLGLKAEASVIFATATRKFSIRCARGTTGWKAQIDTAAAADPLLTIDLGINLDFWAVPSKRELILFHELVHTAFPDDHAAPLVGQMTEEERDKRWREFDRPGSCVSLCYNPDATQCECATCFRKKNCDAPCTSFKACFSTQKGGFCPCNKPNANPPIMPRWYASFTECTTECPKGGLCFGVQCIREENACKK